VKVAVRQRPALHIGESVLLGIDSSGECLFLTQPEGATPPSAEGLPEAEKSVVLQTDAIPV
jgi:hypothetical protein